MPHGQLFEHHFYVIEEGCCASSGGNDSAKQRKVLPYPGDQRRRLQMSKDIDLFLCDLKIFLIFGGGA